MATRHRQAVLAGAATLALALSSCGGSDDEAAKPSKRPAEALPAPKGAKRTYTTPSGPLAEEVAATVRRFYRAAIEKHGDEACGTFTDRGRAGFMKSARASFPGLVNTRTTCPRAMQVFQNTLSASIESLREKGLRVSTKSLKRVNVAEVRANGDRATAVAPLGLVSIRPKRFYFLKEDGGWRIDGSRDFRGSREPAGNGGRRK